MFNRPICHLSLSSIKITWLLILQWEKELVIFRLGETQWTPWHQATTTVAIHLTRDPEEVGRPWTKRGVTQKASRADVTSRLGFWPRGHSITPTVWQDWPEDWEILAWYKLSLNLMANLTTPKPMMEWSNEVERLFTQMYIFFRANKNPGGVVIHTATNPAPFLHVY